MPARPGRGSGLGRAAGGAPLGGGRRARGARVSRATRCARAPWRSPTSRSSRWCRRWWSPSRWCRPSPGWRRSAAQVHELPPRQPGGRRAHHPRAVPRPLRPERPRDLRRPGGRRAARLVDGVALLQRRAGGQRHLGHPPAPPARAAGGHLLGRAHARPAAAGRLAHARPRRRVAGWPAPARRSWRLAGGRSSPARSSPALYFSCPTPGCGLGAALAGGLVAGVAWEIAKWGYTVRGRAASSATTPSTARWRRCRPSSSGSTSPGPSCCSARGWPSWSRTRRAPARRGPRRRPATTRERWPGGPCWRSALAFDAGGEPPPRRAATWPAHRRIGRGGGRGGGGAAASGRVLLGAGGRRPGPGEAAREHHAARRPASGAGPRCEPRRPRLGSGRYSMKSTLKAAEELEGIDFRRCANVRGAGAATRQDRPAVAGPADLRPAPSGPDRS